MVTIITIIHILVCLFLCIVVYLQTGNGGDIAAAFGGQGSQTTFGPRRGATLLTKATVWATVIFMITSITLSIYSARRPRTSVLQGVKNTSTKPAVPANIPSSNPTTPTPPQQNPAPKQ